MVGVYGEGFGELMVVNGVWKGVFGFCGLSAKSIHKQLVKCLIDRGIWCTRSLSGLLGSIFRLAQAWYWDRIVRFCLVINLSGCGMPYNRACYTKGVFIWRWPMVRCGWERDKRCFMLARQIDGVDGGIWGETGTVTRGRIGRGWRWTERVQRRLPVVASVVEGISARRSWGGHGVICVTTKWGS
ncbi:hypothetical protein Tco_0687645 [Tanacetum coccineum]